MANASMHPAMSNYSLFSLALVLLAIGVQFEVFLVLTWSPGFPSHTANFTDAFTSAKNIVLINLFIQGVWGHAPPGKFLPMISIDTHFYAEIPAIYISIFYAISITTMFYSQSYKLTTVSVTEFLVRNLTLL